MKTSKYLPILAALTLAGLLPITVRAQIYVANTGNNTVGEYGFNGSAIHSSLISGLSSPYGLSISGGDIFVANAGNGTVGEYTTAGASVNSSLVSGLSAPWGLVVIPDLVNVGSSDLYVVNYGGDSVDEYTISGGVVTASHPSLITGLIHPTGLAISGGNIYVANEDDGTGIGNSTGSIGEYTLSGGQVNTSLISGLAEPTGLTVWAGDLYVANHLSGTVGQYTTSGGELNGSLISLGANNLSAIASSGGDLFVTESGNNTVGQYTTSGSSVSDPLITGLSSPTGIAITPMPAPEPSTWALLLAGLAMIFGWRRRATIRFGRKLNGPWRYDS